jgi:DNA polymerase III psi subunit
MTRHEAASLQRLKVLGIDIWQARPDRAQSRTGAEADQQPRIRLSSGDGDWLLVQRQPWRGSHEQLIADIMAAIGPARCRFGQWATDSASGENLSELEARGVDHILAFGPAPGQVEWGNLVKAASLDELATDGRARKALWQALSPVLA